MNLDFNDSDVESLFEKIRVFDKMYQIIRFVDPVKKRVIDYKEGKTGKTDISCGIDGDSNCFDIWNKGDICDNCISMRAYNENDTFVKLEIGPKGIFMVTAVPVTVGDRRMVVELLKDATNSMVFGDTDYKKGTEVYSLINNLNTMVLKDVLTGIYNRRYIDEKLPVDILNTMVNSHGLSVIMADIDHFKNINDTYGHVAGDKMLIAFAKCIDGCIRKGSDWVARYGGDEFLICLPNAGNGKADEIAERIRRDFENIDILHGDKHIKATASFGICSIIPGQSISVLELIECADKNLYKAKDRGRNRVTV